MSWKTRKACSQSLAPIAKLKVMALASRRTCTLIFLPLFVPFLSFMPPRNSAVKRHENMITHISYHLHTSHLLLHVGWCSIASTSTLNTLFYFFWKSKLQNSSCSRNLAELSKKAFCYVPRIVSNAGATSSIETHLAKPRLIFEMV